MVLRFCIQEDICLIDHTPIHLIIITRIRHRLPMVHLYINLTLGGGVGYLTVLVPHHKCLGSTGRINWI